MPTTIAIAGGTGPVGRSVVREFQKYDRYRVLVLTRRGQDEIAAISSASTNPNTSYIHVSYADADIPHLAGLLRDNNVHTVISTIGLISEESRDGQLNLIRAASEASDVVQRFVPSEFGYLNVESSTIFDPTISYWIDAANLLSTTSLIYTRFANGFFLDYTGMPYYPSTTLTPFTWAIDKTNRRAAIPSDGNKVISFTLLADAARYLVWVVDSGIEGEKWDEWTFVVGEDITYNRLLELSEKVTGGEKFEVVYESREQIEKREVSIFPMPGEKEVDWDMDAWGGEEVVKEYLALFGIMYDEGLMQLPKENRLSEKLKAELPCTRVEEFLEQTWGRHFNAVAE